MGRTLPEAFIKHWSLQRACEIQVATAAMGTPLDVPPEIVAVHQRDLFKVQIPGGAGKADFDAMVRLVDRSEEHTSELQSLMRISYAAVCSQKQKTGRTEEHTPEHKPLMLTTKR